MIEHILDWLDVHENIKAIIGFALLLVFYFYIFPEVIVLILWIPRLFILYFFGV